MKKKILLFIAIIATLMCLFAISSSAADVAVDGILYSTNTSSGTAAVKGLSDTTITNLVIPDTITDGGKEYRVTSINKNAFANNTTITNVVIGDNVNYFNEGCFKGCTALLNVEMPAAFDYLGSAAFQNCSNLKTIDFSKVTHGNEITFYNYGHFSGCSNLVAISLPEGIKYLKQQSFAGCSNLTAVYLPSTLTHITGNNTKWDHACFKNCSKMYFVQNPFDIDDCFVNGEFVAPAKPSVYYFPSNFVSFGKTDPTSETSTTTTAAFIKCYALNDTIVFPKTCMDFTNQNIFKQMLSGAPSGTTKNIVFLGDITTFNYNDNLNGIRFYFAHENDIDTTSFTNAQASTSSNGNAYMYFCNKNYYVMNAFSTKLTSENENHLQSDKSVLESPATCVDYAVYATKCFCGAPLGEVKGTELDPDNHDLENATLVSIVYASYTDKGIKKVTCGYNCGENIDLDVDPILTTKGYSIKNDGCGIVAGYDINIKALEEYETAMGDIEIGIIMANSSFDESTGFMTKKGEDDKYTLNSDYGIQLKITSRDYSRINSAIANFTTAESELKLVMALYVVDAKGVSYIQHKGQGTYADEVESAGVTLDVVTIKNIATITGTDLQLPEPKALPVENKENY